MSNRFIYSGNRTREIAFPLGGMGTGCIGLAGNGRLIEWEIFNRPDKCSYNGFSHFAVKAEADGRFLDARVLQGDLTPPYSGVVGSAGLGSGLARESMAGLPHFRDAVFRGEFPFAGISFREPKFPGQVTLQAFNPFIPLQEDDSSLPAAFFEVSVKNPTSQPITYTVCLSARNPLPGGQTVNHYASRGGLSTLRLGSTGIVVGDPRHGEVVLATDAGSTSHQEYWYRSDCSATPLRVYWRDFMENSRFRNRSYPSPKHNLQDHAVLAAHFRVAPGSTGKVRFVLAWYFPTCFNYWRTACDCKPRKPVKTWKNYYAKLFPGAGQVAAYALKNWARLHRETHVFKDALFSSTLPAAALDAVSANLSILKSPTVLRLEDGSLYGWEGCGCRSGCCEGTCTHVWNYAYALPFLFPRMERSLRELDYRYNQRADGRMSFRLMLPPGGDRCDFRACVDGQFGGVIKVYREWRISGDTAWLKRLWPKVKKSIEYAWADTNEDRWDPEKAGVITGLQHHTLDTELFGPNSWLTGFYLAALKAGAELADAVNDGLAAKEYRRLFARGRVWLEKNLFNGEYYVQRINLKDKTLVRKFKPGIHKKGTPDFVATYWDEEYKEIRFQIGEGCGIDQVVAQWHANLCGLGNVFDPARTRAALRAIYRHNFKRPLRDYANFCRLYCLNDEAGTVMFDWPAGRRKPVVPVSYADETMHGFEYQVAAHMIQEGMVKEGEALVKAVRDRYDGERRNPWNEFECGSHYARSMASYSLLPAYSGFHYDLTRGEFGFNPAVKGTFRAFWSLDGAWGMLGCANGRAWIEVRRGALTLQRLKLPFLRGARRLVVGIGKQPLAVVREDDSIRLVAPFTLCGGRTLTVRNAKP